MSKHGKVTVWDGGLFPYVATKLAEGFNEVAYYTPYQADAFPTSRKVLWGRGLPGVDRSVDFFNDVSNSEIIVFPDHGMGDLQEFLRKQGYNVWGSGAAEMLELDRIRFRKLQQAKRMNVPISHVLEGTELLEEHLRDSKNKDQFVKLGEFRGDLETYKHKNWNLTEPWFKELDHKLGPMRSELKFLAEHTIPDAAEVGFDGVVIDGKFLTPCVYGYEAKDIAYVGKVCDYDELPMVILDVNSRLIGVLGELGARSFFSTEIRVTEDGTGYLIDPCLRAPSPPTECLLEVFSNWPEIFWNGAQGSQLSPKPVGKYCAEVVLRSSYASDNFLAIKIPNEYRKYVKLHGHSIVDGVDYVVALGMDVIGATVGIGDTMEDASKLAMDVAESLEAYQLEFSEDSFDHVKNQIDLGIKHGIDW